MLFGDLHEEKEYAYGKIANVNPWRNLVLAESVFIEGCPFLPLLQLLSGLHVKCNYKPRLNQSYS